MKLGKFLGVFWDDWLARMSGILGVIAWGASAVFEFIAENLPAALSFFVLGALGLIIAAYRIWKKADDELDKAKDQLARRGLTDARRQEAMAGLSELDATEKEFLRQVLLDRPIEEHSAKRRAQERVPGSLDVGKLERFLSWELGGDNLVSIKEGYIDVLSELLLEQRARPAAK